MIHGVRLYVLTCVFLATWAAAGLLGCENESLDHELEPRGIVNGEETGYKEWQGTVGLLDMSVGAMCTGTLIDPEVVLTAGHCLMNTYDGSLVQILGGANMDVLFTHIQDWAFNPDYSLGNMVGDMALIHLAEPITKYECYGVRDGSSPKVGTRGWVVGYGLASSDDLTSSGVHRKGEAQVLTLTWEETQLEVGDPSSTCQGDSGGPFFTEQNGHWVATGITSYGTSNYCNPRGDSWSTNVYHWRDWIDEIMVAWTGHGLDETGCTDPGADSDADSDSDSDTDSDGDGGPDSDADSDEDGGADSDDGDDGRDAGLGEESSAEDCGCAAPGQPRERAPGSVMSLLTHVVF